MTSISSLVESLLFVSGEPLSLKKLCKVSGKENMEVKEALAQLAARYQKEEGGIRLIQKEEEFQLVSASEYKEYVNQLIKSDLEEDLSKAALEVLAVIAYRGPISRSQIEDIRGVNCSFTARNLLMRGLIERVENPRDTRSYLYKISFDFLKHLGLGSREELPQYDQLIKEVKEGEGSEKYV